MRHPCTLRCAHASCVRSFARQMTGNMSCAMCHQSPCKLQYRARRISSESARLQHLFVQEQEIRRCTACIPCWVSSYGNSTEQPCTQATLVPAKTCRCNWQPFESSLCRRGRCATAENHASTRQHPGGNTPANTAHSRNLRAACSQTQQAAHSCKSTHLMQ